MNEITAAIKKKAFEKFPNTNSQVRREAYTSGQEDAIGFMLKFDKWKNDNYLFVIGNGYCVKEDWQKPVRETLFYTTEQLLLKYMENEGLL